MDPDKPDPKTPEKVRVISPSEFINMLRKLPPAEQEATTKASGPTYRPATADEARALLRGTRLTVGDIVQVRPEVAPMFKWPTAEDRCVVTQVIDPPIRAGEYGTAQAAERGDIALAFIGTIGERTVLCEFVHDSRNFTKVGHIASEAPR